MQDPYRGLNILANAEGGGSGLETHAVSLGSTHLIAVLANHPSRRRADGVRQAARTGFGNSDLRQGWRWITKMGNHFSLRVRIGPLLCARPVKWIPPPDVSLRRATLQVRSHIVCGALCTRCGALTISHKHTSARYQRGFEKSQGDPFSGRSQRPSEWKWELDMDRRTVRDHSYLNGSRRLPTCVPPP